MTLDNQCLCCPHHQWNLRQLFPPAFATTCGIIYCPPHQWELRRFLLPHWLLICLQSANSLPTVTLHMLDFLPSLFVLSASNLGAGPARPSWHWFDNRWIDGCDFSLLPSAILQTNCCDMMLTVCLMLFCLDSIADCCLFCSGSSLFAYTAICILAGGSLPFLQTVHL